MGSKCWYGLALVLMLLSPLESMARDEPRSSGQVSPLAALANLMPPGSWAELPTDELDRRLLKAPLPSRGLDILGWSDDAHWDSGSGQLLFMGLRQRRRFIGYSEAGNRWRDIGLYEDHEGHSSPPVASKFGHAYSNNALDPERGVFFHLFHPEGRPRDGGAPRPGGISAYDIASGRWSRLPQANKYVMTGGIEYFSAMTGLVMLVDHQVWLLDSSGHWRLLGELPERGHHTLIRHNPFRKEVLFVGGNDAASRIVVRLSADGRLQRMRDAPTDLGVRVDKLTVDPVSGRYLILDGDRRRLYEFDSELNRYRLVDDFTRTPWPFSPEEMPAVAFLPEHGVTLWFARRVWLYRHNPLDDGAPGG